MKGNKSLYILLPVVFIVWGLIIFRIIKYVGQSNAAVTPIMAEIKFEPEKFEADTFSIAANYRDPFLGEIVVASKATSGVPPKPQSIAKPAVKTETPWPTISFHGLIKNKDSKKTYALLTVNGKTKSFSDKDEWQGLKVLNAEKDSVLLIYNKQKKSFRKK